MIGESNQYTPFYSVTSAVAPYPEEVVLRHAVIRLAGEFINKFEGNAFFRGNRTEILRTKGAGGQLPMSSCRVLLPTSKNHSSMAQIRRKETQKEVAGRMT